MTLESKSERTSLCCSRNSGAFCSFKLSDVLSGGMPFIQVPYKDQPHLMAAEPNLRAQGPHFLAKAGSYMFHLGLS